MILRATFQYPRVNQHSCGKTMVSPGQQSMSGTTLGHGIQGKPPETVVFWFFQWPIWGVSGNKNNPKKPNGHGAVGGLQSALSFCRLPPLGGLRKAARRGLRTLLEGVVWELGSLGTTSFLIPWYHVVSMLFGMFFVWLTLIVHLRFLLPHPFC